MMKKYNTPEIVALALETVDVITSSGVVAATNALAQDLGVSAANLNVTQLEEHFSEMNNKWSW